MMHPLRIKYKSLFLPRVAEFIYIEGDNKTVSSAGITNFIYNEALVSGALPSSSVNCNRLMKRGKPSNK